MLSKQELHEIIAREALSDNSLFNASIIDLSNYEVIYANETKKESMADIEAKHCWESIHAQEDKCMWCKVSLLKQNNLNTNQVIYESFNEVANKWYQVQDKIIKSKNGKELLVSFSIDITMQKEAQSQLIETHVKLSQQTKALQNAQAKLRNQANRDPMTNMYNRRYFNDISKKIVALSKRNSEPLSVMMIDIDKFKNINDTYGHSTGDEVIKNLANKINNLIRDSDVSARFGGEEFTIILPNTTSENAEKLAQKIRMEIEALSSKINEEIIKFTISIGVAEFNYENDTVIDDALSNADKALYESKTNGRNLVTVFRE